MNVYVLGKFILNIIYIIIFPKFGGVYKEKLHAHTHLSFPRWQNSESTIRET